MALRAFSYGGGVQSTAALVLAAQGKIDFQTFLFANVGDDSEHPATLRYVREVAMPFAEAHGITLHELRKYKRVRRVDADPSDPIQYELAPVTLYGELTREDVSSTRLPVRLAPSGALGHRDCTIEFKIRVIDRWLKLAGATAEQPATVGLGISLDEFQRARSARDEREPFRLREYPLIALRLDRSACVQIIERAGLLVPPKSSCYFCPFHTLRNWQHMRDNDPALFERAVELERIINVRRERQGREQVYFTDKMVPLDEATSPHRQLPLLDDREDTCESGYCMV